MKTTMITWLKLFTIFIITTLFTSHLYGVDINLDGTIAKVIGDNLDDETTCKAGDYYKLTNTTLYNGDTPFDILLHVVKEENEADELTEDTNYHRNRCIGLTSTEKYANTGALIEILIRALNRNPNDTNVTNTRAYMDIEFIPIRKTENENINENSLNNLRLNIDNLAFTAFDLDLASSLSGTDDVYIASPGEAYDDPNNASQVTIVSGDKGSDFNQKHYILGRGINGECDDEADSADLTCRLSGTMRINHAQPKFLLRLYNSNAYGAGPLAEIHDTEEYRLFQLSLSGAYIPGQDHGDLPTTYGDAYHKIDKDQLFMGAEIDEEEISLKSKFEGIYNEGFGDDSVYEDEYGMNHIDDEDAVSIVGSDEENLTMTEGYDTNFSIITKGHGYLSVWADYNGDENFAGEQILTDYEVNSVDSVQNYVSLTIPNIDSNETRNTYIRFRLSTEQNIASYGNGAIGEVEDYVLRILPSGRVTGTVYNDINGNAQRDEGEEGFPNVHVTVTAENGETQVVLTDANGSYRVEHVAEGTANVTVTESDLPVGAIATNGTTNPTTVEVLISKDNFEEDNGYQLQANLVTVKTVGSASPQEGEIVTYTLEVRNEGASNATDINLTDSLPAGVTYEDSNASVGEYNATTGLWNIGTLANGATATLTIDARVNQGTASTDINNTATAAETPNQNDPTTDGDVLTATMHIAPIPTMSVQDVTVTEGETLSFTVTLTEPSNFPTTIKFNTIDGVGTTGAESPADYTALTNYEIVIPAGSTTGIVEINTTDDLIVEQTETFTLDINVTEGSIANPHLVVRGTILDNEEQNLQIGNATVAEEDGHIDFNVSIPNPSSEATEIALSIDHNTTNNDDFGIIPTTATIPVGQTYVIVEIPVTDDNIAELNETFILHGEITSNLGNAQVSDGIGMITDEQDREALTLSVDNVKVIEQDTDQIMHFQVNLSMPSSIDTEINMTITDNGDNEDNTNGKTSSNDHSAPSPITVIIPAFNTSAEVNITAYADTILESDENFNLAGTITSEIATGIIGNGTGTIEDDDRSRLQISNDSAKEGDDNLTFTVELNETSNTPTKVRLNIEEITSTLTSDDYGILFYTPVDGNRTEIDMHGGEIIIPADTKSVIVTLEVLVDNNYTEVPEDLYLQGEIVEGNYIGSVAQGLGSITERGAPELLRISNVTAHENDGTMTFVLRLEQPNAAPTIIDLVLEDGNRTNPNNNAHENSDFESLVETTITIPANETEYSVTIPLINDDVAEFEEIYFLTGEITSLLGQHEQRGTGTIIDDDTQTFSINNVTVAEEDGHIDFNVSIPNPSSEATEIALSIDHNTTNNDDFGIIPTTATIPVGQTYVIVEIPVTDDNIAELNETFILHGEITSNLGNAQVSDGIGMITDEQDREALTLSVDNVKVIEQDTDQIMHFQVNLSMPSSIDTEINMTITDNGDNEDNTNGKTSSNDHSAPSPITVIIPAFNTSAEVNITAYADTILESDENFNLAGTITSEIATGIIGNGTGTIEDDDRSRLQISNDSAKEGDDNLTFTVELNETSNTPTKVRLNIEEITSTLTSDDYGILFYTPVDGNRTEIDMHGGEIIIPADTKSVIVTLEVLVDNNYTEVPEDLYLQGEIVEGNYIGSVAQGLGSITERGAPELLRISNVTAHENDGTMTFVLRLEQPNAAPTIIDLVLEDGNRTNPNNNAHENSDFESLVETTITIPANETEYSVTIPLINDDVAEFEEIYFLTGEITSLLGQHEQRGTGTIIDDDTQTFSINNVTVAEEDGHIDFNVSIPNPSSEATEIALSIDHNTTNNDDFGIIPTTATIPVGQTYVIVEIPVTDDNIAELNETFILHGEITSNLGNAQVSDGIGMITDEQDREALTLSVDNVKVIEQDTDQIMHFQVNLSMPSSIDTEINMTITDNGDNEDNTNGKTSSNDHSAPSPITVIIPAFNTSAEVNITAYADTILESDENFNLAGTITSEIATGIIGNGTGTIEDDDRSRLQISNDSAKEGDDNLTFTVELNETSNTPTKVRLNIEEITSTLTSDDYGILFYTPVDGNRTEIDMHGGEIIIPADTKSVIVTLEVLVDNNYTEVPEDLYLQGEIVEGNYIGSVAQGLGSITERGAPELLRISNVTAHENDGTMTFVLRLEQPNAAPTIIDLVLEDGNRTNPNNNAHENSDFESLVETTITIPANETEYSVTIPLINDDVAEFEEIYFLTGEITSLLGQHEQRGTGTIIDDDTQTFSINNVTVAEEDGHIDFNVSIPNPSSEATEIALSIDHNTTNNDDFGIIPTTATIPVGQTYVIVEIPVTDDNIAELNETFILHGEITSNLGNAQVSDGIGMITDEQDREALTLSVDNVKVIEQDTDQIMHFQVNLSMPSSIDTEINMTITDNGDNEDNTNGKTSSNDHSAPSPITVIIPAFNTSAEVNITAYADTILESDENFNLAGTITSEIATGIIGNGTGTIEDDDRSRLQISNDSAKEGDDNLTFTVELNETSNTPTKVRLNIEEITSTLTSDDYGILFYTPVDGNRTEIDMHGGEIIIPADTKSVIVTLEVLVDNNYTEVPEDLYLQGEIVEGNYIGSVAQGLGSITERGAPELLRISNVTAHENDGTMTFVLRLEQPNAAPTIIDLVLEDGNRTNPNNNAHENSDFESLVETTITIPANETEYSVTIPLINDDVAEFEEIYFLTGEITSLLGQHEQRGTGTIIDDDTQTFSINNVTVAEEDGHIDFNVSIPNPSSEATEIALSIDHNTTNNDDFGIIPTTATIPVGQTYVIVEIPVTDDNIAELNETFILHGEITSNLGNAQVSDGIGMITDEQDREALTLSVDNVKVIEQDTDQIMHFQVNLSMPSSIDTEINMTITDNGDNEDNTNGKTSSNDHSAPSPITVIIPAFNTSAEVNITAYADTILESDENFNLAGTITSEIATGIIGNGTGTIEDDDRSRLQISNDSAKEGDDNLTFTVELNETSNTPTKVRLNIEEITSTLTSDDYGILFYTPVDGNRTEIDMHGGEIIIPADTKSVIVTLEVLVDNNYTEVPEDLYLQGEIVEGNYIGSVAQGLGSITERGAPELLRISNVTAHENDGTMTFVLRLEQPNAAPTIIDLVLEDGNRTNPNNNAHENSDFESLVETTITIPANETEYSVTIPLINDDVAEFEEIYFLTGEITSLLGQHEQRGTGTIIDDDTPTVIINPNGDTVTAIEGEDLVFEINLSNPSSEDIVIEFHTQDGTAVTPDDYTETIQTVTIPAGALGITFTVPTNDDIDDEETENMTIVGHVSSGNVQNTEVNGTGLILDNNTLPEDDNATATVGEEVTIDILDNDGLDIDPSSVQLVDMPNAILSDDNKTLTVPGEGNWTVNDDGTLTFTPEAGFIGDPTPVEYTVADNNGVRSQDPATVNLNYEIGTIAGSIFEDSNGDGVQNPNEPGLEGVVVEITDSNGVVHTLTTDANGQYAMEVPAGVITVQIDENTLPAGSTQVVGTNPTELTVPEDGIANDIDGYKPADNAGEIQGVVYEDTNGNGTQDANEPGIEGVKVIITEEGNRSRVVTTDSEGSYSVTVAPGTVTVDINDSTIPAGSTHIEGTDPIDVVVPENGTESVIDGYEPAANRGTVAGVVYVDANGNGVKDDDEPGLSGVTVEITDSEGHIQTVQTDENGNYEVQVIEGTATTTIDESTLPGGSKATEGSTNPTTLAVVANETVTDSDGYQLPEPNGRLEGVVYFDTNADGSQDPGENGIAGVHVSIIDSRGSIQTLVTDANGEYSTGISAGDAIIDIAQEDLPQSYVQLEGTDPTPVTVPENGIARDADGFKGTSAPATLPDVAEHVTVGTAVTIDVLENDNDVEGDMDPTTVQIIDPDTNEPVKELVVDGQGTWTVEDNGSITFTPEDGFTGDPDPISYTVADSLGNASEPTSVTADYEQHDPVSHEDNVSAPVGDTVLIDVLGNDTDLDGDINRSSLRLVDPETNESVTEIVVPGEGTWNVDENGTLTFTPEPGFIGDPTPVGYTVADNTGLVSEPATVNLNYEIGTIAGSVFEDSNGDGVQNPNEPGLEGVVVEITDSNGVVHTLTTDANGQYAMEVPAGVITVQIDENTLPAGSTQVVGTNPTELTVPEDGIANDIDGYKPADNAGEIQGVVYEDTNGNGTQDANEPGIEGVKVIITEEGNRSRVVTTDSEGSYSVTVAPGTVTVDINDSTIPAGSTHIEGTDPIDVVVPENGTESVIDGYEPAANRGTVAGVVYVDANGNGVKDDDEPGLSGVTVEITDSEGHIQTVQTDENGNYEVQVIEGTATTTIDESTLPGGSKATEGSTNPTTLAVVANETVTDSDGYQLPEPNGRLEGVVYFDTNADGSQDPGENGIAGVHVSIIDSRGSIQTLVTDANGEYSTGISAGDAIIDIAQEDLPQSYVQLEGTDPTPVTVPENGIARDADGFKGTSAPATLPDVAEHVTVGTAVTIDVLENDNDVEGDMDPTTVQIIDPDTNEPVKELVVDGQGTWTVEDNGSITFTPEDGFTGDPDPISYTVADSLGNASEPTSVTADYEQHDPVSHEDNVSAPVGDTVLIDVLGNDTDLDGDINRSSLRLVDPETNESVTEIVVPGEGTWNVDENGTLTFTPEPGFIGDPTPVGYTVADNTGLVSEPATVNLNYEIGTIAGSVFEDSNGDGVQNPNEPGLEGVVVEITDSNGVVHTLTTDANGQYAMEVPAGVITVQIDENTLPAGSTQVVGTNPTELTVPEDGIANDIDGYKPADNAGEIQGVVYEDTNGNGTQDANEPGIEGVKVIITEEGNRSRVVTTDSEGSYSVTVAPGTVTVDINDSTIPAGSTHIEGTDPIDVVVPENGTESVIDGYEPAANRGTVAGVVYVDANGNGVKDDDEPGLSGVTVEITDSEGHIQTVQTDENGNYEVQVIEGTATTTIDESTLPGGSKATEGSTNPTTLAVVANETVTDSDGYQLPEPNGRLEGVVYFDTNADGSQDPGENGIAGVHVSIIDSRGSIQTLVTDANGEYSTGISAGDAIIDIAQEDLPQSYVQLEGTDPTPVTVPENGIARDADGFKGTSAPATLPDVAEHVTVGTAVTIDVLENDNDVEGDMDPTTVQIIDPDTNEPVKELVVDGQGTWTVEDNGSITFTPEDGFTGDPDPISYTVADSLGNASEPTSVTADYEQAIEANPDRAENLTVGEAVTIDVLENDDAVNGLDRTSVRIDGAPGDGKELVVDGEGVWTVDNNGSITFTPLYRFTGDPTPITYTVADNEGTRSEPAQLVADYAQAIDIKDDTIDGITVGEAVTIDVLANDESESALNPSSVKIDGAPGDGKELVVSGEGIWTVDSTGKIIFTPEADFTGDPTPIEYTVEDILGNISDKASVSVDYDQQNPDAANDSANSEVGDAVTLDILSNDEDNEDDINASSVSLIEPNGIEGVDARDTDGDGDIDTIVVPNEGTWSVDANGIVSFAPIAGFTGDPTPIGYTVSDDRGNISNEASITVDANQRLRDDSNYGYYGEAKTLSILSNDDMVYPHTINLIGPEDSSGEDTDGDGDIDEIVVPGEGRWHVNNKGQLTFTPERNFIGNPTPISYTAKDSSGNTIEAATVTIIYSARPSPIIITETKIVKEVETKYETKYKTKYKTKIKTVVKEVPEDEPIVAGDESRPLAVDDNYTISDATSYTFDVSENDSFILGDIFNVIDPTTSDVLSAGSIVRLAHGTVTMQENGTFVYRPYPETLSQDIYLDETFKYKITRSNGTSSIATVYICIECLETSDADALSTLTMLMLMFMTGVFGLYFIAKEENE